MSRIEYRICVQCLGILVYAFMDFEGRFYVCLSFWITMWRFGLLQLQGLKIDGFTSALPFLVVIYIAEAIYACFTNTKYGLAITWDKALGRGLLFTAEIAITVCCSPTYSMVILLGNTICSIIQALAEVYFTIKMVMTSPGGGTSYNGGWEWLDFDEDNPVTGRPATRFIGR